VEIYASVSSVETKHRTFIINSLHSSQSRSILNREKK